jgi:proteasome lid subunit RPN8/RPN11
MRAETMILPAVIVREMFAHAEKEAPVEACGYLAGTGEIVTRRYPMTNTDRSEEHFTLDPKEQFSVMKAVRQDCLEILAIYHSHPASPARPSDEDIRLAYDPAVVYVIVSLLGGARTIKGFRIRQGTVEEERLSITEENE